MFHTNVGSRLEIGVLLISIYLGSDVCYLVFPLVFRANHAWGLKMGVAVQGMCGRYLAADLTGIVR
jgi:hypothetical protein